MKERPTHCADCGDLLDPFGMCPHTDPEDAKRMVSPVNCGKTLTQVLIALRTTREAA